MVSLTYTRVGVKLINTKSTETTLFTHCHTGIRQWERHDGNLTSSFEAID